MGKRNKQAYAMHTPIRQKNNNLKTLNQKIMITTNMNKKIKKINKKKIKNKKKITKEIIHTKNE